ncbi:MAG: hypothetical protein ACR5KV_05335 [Wolbachia sp.]
MHITRTSRVLIDPKDIISSENIIAILEELERYDDMLEIQIEEKAASDANNNVNIYNPFIHKMIGVMNNIVPYFMSQLIRNIHSYYMLYIT